MKTFGAEGLGPADFGLSWLTLPFIFPGRNLPTRAEKPFFAAPGSVVLETDIRDVSVLKVLSLAGAEPSLMAPKKLLFFSGGGKSGVGASPD